MRHFLFWWVLTCSIRTSSQLYLLVVFLFFVFCMLWFVSCLCMFIFMLTNSCSCASASLSSNKGKACSSYYWPRECSKYSVKQLHCSELLLLISFCMVKPAECISQVHVLAQGTKNQSGETQASFFRQWHCDLLCPLWIGSTCFCDVIVLFLSSAVCVTLLMWSTIAAFVLKGSLLNKHIAVWERK